MRKRENFTQFSMIFLFFLFTLLIIILMASKLGDATITGVSPPGTGDWNINSNTKVTNQTVYIKDGSITVYTGVKFEVYDSIIQLNCTLQYANIFRGGSITIIKNTMWRCNTTIADVVFWVGYAGTGLALIDFNNSTFCRFHGVAMAYSNGVAVGSKFTNSRINDTLGYGIQIGSADSKNCLFENLTLVNCYRDMGLSANATFKNVTGNSHGGTLGVQIIGARLRPTFINCTDIYVYSFDTVGSGFNTWNYPRMKFYDGNYNLINPTISIVNSTLNVKWTGLFISGNRSPILMPGQNVSYVNIVGQSRYWFPVENWYILWNAKYYSISAIWDNIWNPYNYTFKDTGKTIVGDAVTQQSVCTFNPTGNFTLYSSSVVYNSKVWMAFYLQYGNLVNGSYVNEIRIGELDNNFRISITTATTIRSLTNTSYMGLVSASVFNNSIYIMWCEMIGTKSYSRYCRFEPGSHSVGPLNTIGAGYTTPGNLVTWGNALWFIYNGYSSAPLKYYLNIKGLNLNGTWTVNNNYTTIDDFYTPHGCYFNNKIYIAGNELSPNRLYFITWDGSTFANPNIIIDTGHSWQRYASMVIENNNLWIFYKCLDRSTTWNSTDTADIGLKILNTNGILSSYYSVVDDNKYNSYPSAILFNGNIQVYYCKEKTARTNNSHENENGWMITIDLPAAPLTAIQQLEASGNDLINLLIWVMPVVIFVGIFTSIIALLKFKK